MALWALHIVSKPWSFQFCFDKIKESPKEVIGLKKMGGGLWEVILRLLKNEEEGIVVETRVLN